MLNRAMSHHEKGEQPCHLCDTATLLEEETLLDHILTRHYHELHLKQESLLDSSKLIGTLSNLYLDILSKLKGIFHHYRCIINIIMFVIFLSFLYSYRAHMGYYDETLTLTLTMGLLLLTKSTLR